MVDHQADGQRLDPTTPRPRNRDRLVGQESASLIHRTVESSEFLAAVETIEARSPGSDSMGFRIYDDSLPASSQPQTPQNLPESRHRSRLLGAHTAPVHGSGSRMSGLG